MYHPVKRKFRIVFDCSLKFRDVCLNSELLQGPDLANSLLGILIRFREERIAFLGDIEQMFYRVKVPCEYRNYLRFFWFPHDNLSERPIEYRLTVHVFGAKSSLQAVQITLYNILLK